MAGLRRAALFTLAGAALLVPAATAAADPAFWFLPSTLPRLGTPAAESPPKPAKRPARPASARAKVAKPEAPVIAVPPGPLQVVVSIAQQRIALYADGQLVHQAPVSTGTRSHPTPMGVFSVIQKSRHHVSNIYYAKMPYMQRLTWSGTALHEGPLPGYPASHGCVRMTKDFAALLWGATRLGTRVIVTRDEVAPVEIRHTALLVPAEPAVAVATADASMTTGSLPDPASGATTPARATTLPADAAPSAARRKGLLSVFVSRKDGRLYVRHGTEPLFDAPVTIREPDQPTGTHVFTAMQADADSKALRWTSLSIPSAYPRPVADGKARTKRGKAEARQAKPDITAELPQPVVVPHAASVLDRIGIPDDVRSRIAGLVGPGASLIVSDNGISNETGRHTDFIILTR